MAEPLTTWAKIVPRRDTADPSVGLAARIADPLWLLARQYQLGEFRGDDGAEPVRVDVRATWTPFTRWLPGASPQQPTAGLPLDRLRQPLESLVEDDRALAGPRRPRLVDIVEAGHRLRRALRAGGAPAVADAWLAAHTVVADPAAPGDGGELFGGRALDGFAVRATLGAADDADAVERAIDAAVPGLGAGERVAAVAATAEWRTWFDTRFGYTARPHAWIPEQLEHCFRVAAPHPDGGELVFEAPEYLGQGVAWHELDLVPAVSGQEALHDLGAAADVAQVREVVFEARFPQRLRWPGMPVDRFWEMEDAAVDFGNVHLAASDIAGLLAVDMAVTASTDWFVLGVPMPVGGAARVDSVVVTDVFGDRTLIRLGTRERTDLGRLYEPATVGGGLTDVNSAPWLVLPPALVRRVDGPPLEDVMLIRDEMANLGWAVEITAQLADGEPVDVASTLPPLPPVVRNAAAPERTLAYQLSSEVPANWRPLVPTRVDDGPRVFVAGRLFGSSMPAPLTVLVEQLGAIRDEEVPREGKRLRRFWQYGRWQDGSRHLWCGREVLAGRGEGNSGLRYDLTSRT